MRVILAQSLGLCFGVRDALATARAIENPVHVTVFGHLVHNPLVTRELAARGFSLAHEPARDAAATQTPGVLITAHGISDRQRQTFQTLGKHMIDTTCPLVRRAHHASKAFARTGHFVVVIGRPTHVEVLGLTGDLEPGRFAVVDTPDDIRQFPADRIGIIAQTTAVESEVLPLVERIEARNPQASVQFSNTICQPTRDRQAALDALLVQVDVLVVVGGKDSNNARQLVARAGMRAIPVVDASAIAAEMFSPHETVGLTAGTSTLPETIEAVRRRLEGFHAHASLPALPPETTPCP